MRINRKLALNIAVVAALGTSGSAAFAMTDAAGATGVVPTPRGGVLYDQTDSASGNGAPDQNFEAAFDAYDSEAADDFVVTEPTGWTINRINTVGTTGTPGGALVDVNFYMDVGGAPDTVAICSYSAISPTDTLGSFNIDLPTDCILPPGTHWVAIQVDQNFGTFGQHFWSNRSVDNGSGGVWRNPGDGFGSGCTDWSTAGTVCGVGGGFNDFLFSLEGVLGGFVVDADLGIAKTATGGDTFGGAANFALTATNDGPNDANGVVVTDTLPGNVTYVSNDCGASEAGGVVTWNIGPLANGGSAFCNIQTTVSDYGAISNTASITGDDDDPNASNNSSTAGLEGVIRVIPTLGLWGLMAMIGTMLAGVFVMTRARD